jgi:hypothetical protein
MATTTISAVLTAPPALTRLDSVETVSRESDVQSPSSLGDDSTPDTELSLSSEPPLELGTKKISTSIDPKANARRKAASLSLEEQVSGLLMILQSEIHYNTS